MVAVRVAAEVSVESVPPIPKFGEVSLRKNGFSSVGDKSPNHFSTANGTGEAANPANRRHQVPRYSAGKHFHGEALPVTWTSPEFRTLSLPIAPSIGDIPVLGSNPAAAAIQLRSVLFPDERSCSNHRRFLIQIELRRAATEGPSCCSFSDLYVTSATSSERNITLKSTAKIEN